MNKLNTKIKIALSILALSFSAATIGDTREPTIHEYKVVEAGAWRALKTTFDAKQKTLPNGNQATRIFDYIIECSMASLSVIPPELRFTAFQAITTKGYPSGMQFFNEHAQNPNSEINQQMIRVVQKYGYTMDWVTNMFLEFGAVFRGCDASVKSNLNSLVTQDLSDSGVLLRTHHFKGADVENGELLSVHHDEIESARHAINTSLLSLFDEDPLAFEGIGRAVRASVSCKLASYTVFPFEFRREYLRNIGELGVHQANSIFEEMSADSETLKRFGLTKPSLRLALDSQSMIFEGCMLVMKEDPGFHNMPKVE